MNNNLLTKSAMYETPEAVLLESVAESLFCLSDGVQLDQLTEVEETW